MEHNYIDLQKEMDKYLTIDDINDVKKAYIYAHSAHDGQIRKSGEPYIIHPISVAIVLAEQKLPKSVIISGLLHDVVEDTDRTMEDLVEHFGQDVADIVDGVTKLGNIPGLSADQVKAENHRKIIMATAKDVRVILVKLADRVHNMSTIKHMSKDKQKIIASETLEVYTPIAHKLGMYRIKWELEDLSFKVINNEAYIDIAKRLQMKRSEREMFVDAMIDETEDILRKNNVESKVRGRSKHIYSIFKKMKNKNQDFDELTDLFAFRIIVDSVAECYTALGLIHENYKPIPMRFKDYIPTPKHNMYQSIHTTVINRHGMPVEFQIRTKEMDITAEYGIAAHWMYKNDSDNVEVQETVNYKVDWLREALENSDMVNPLDFMDQVKNDILGNSLIVYTPKGDVVELPLDSTVLDFAYYIHTKVGNEAVSAKVNGKVVSLFYRLKIGDVVHVITSDVASPSISYMAKVKTTRARESIRKYFKNIEKQSIRNEGMKLLVKCALDSGIDNIRDLLKEGKSQFLLLEFGSKNNNDFLYEIGVGDIKIDSIVNFIKSDLSSITSICNSVLIKNDLDDENYDVRMCRYCSPLVGDKIVATKNIYNQTQNEYIIHRNHCAHSVDGYGAIWTETDDKAIYICRLTLEIVDSISSTSQVLNTIGALGFNITSIYMRASIGYLASGKISLEMHSLDDYDRLQQALMDLENVHHVSRAIEGV